MMHLPPEFRSLKALLCCVGFVALGALFAAGIFAASHLKFLPPGREDALLIAVTDPGRFARVLVAVLLLPGLYCLTGRELTLDRYVYRYLLRWLYHKLLWMSAFCWGVTLGLAGAFALSGQSLAAKQWCILGSSFVLAPTLVALFTWLYFDPKFVHHPSGWAAFPSTACRGFAPLASAACTSSSRTCSPRDSAGVDALESIASYLEDATDQERCALWDAVARALARENALPVPRPEFLNAYEDFATTVLDPKDA